MAARERAIQGLMAADASDADRYVRGYAFEALAAMEPVAGAKLRAALEQADDHSALDTAEPEACAASADERCRWLCARRLCPLTTPTSPF